MKTSFISVRFLVPVLALLTGGLPVGAALVAQYTFEGNNADDSSGSANAYDLSPTAGTAAPTYLSEGGNTFVHFAGDNGGTDGQALITPAGALEANDDDGNSAWIVSLWFRTEDWTQGNYRGIFSTADNNTDSRGWQLDSTSGAGRGVRNNAGTNATFLWSAQPTEDDWHHLYLKKTSNTNWELFLDKTSIVADNTNVGRVDEIRLGTIRGSINGLRMDMDYVQVWDTITDPNTDLNTVYSAGQTHLGIVPEPSALALLVSALGLVAFLRPMARR